MIGLNLVIFLCYEFVDLKCFFRTDQLVSDWLPVYTVVVLD